MHVIVLRCLLLCLFFIAVVYVPLVGASAVQTDSPSAAAEEKPPLFLPHQLKLKYPDYELDVQRLDAFSTPVEAFRGNYTFDRFEQEAEALLQKWLAKERLLYYDLTLEVCNILDSTSWKNRDSHPNHLNFIRDDKMKAECLRRAWEKSREPYAPEIPLDAELRLLQRIAGSSWPAHRSEKMALFAHGFQRLAAEIDENHNFSKQLSMRAPFPLALLESFQSKGRAIRSRMAPSAIKDPKLRAESEKLIVEHRRELEERSRQTILRKWNRSFSHWIGKHIVFEYLIPPHNTSELESYLEKYINDEEVKRTIRTEYAQGLIKYNESLQKEGK